MSRTLANTAVRIATAVLKRNPAGEHQCFRVKNLHSEEVIQFVDEWPDRAASCGLEHVQLIVADSLGGAVQSRFVAEPGCSITHYRNHNRKGLVYIETSVQSDEQGLQNMFSLRDSNFLDGSFDGYAELSRGVPGLLVEEAWRGSSGKNDVPQLLLLRLLQVIKLLHPEVEPVPVRRFVAFVELACRLWIDSDATVDAAVADRIIGSSLWALEMFPDFRWNENAVESRIRRRLELNVRHADLVDGSTELDSAMIAAKAKVARFFDSKNNLIPEPLHQQWRERCAAYGAAPSAENRRQIPYEIFCQLFSKDVAGLQLGDKVRAEIDQNGPERLPEFDALDVTSGLNSRSSHDANRLLDAVPPRGLKALADLVSDATRKSVERVSVPPRKRFFNPAIEIVRLVQRVNSDSAGREAGVVEIELGNPKAQGSPSHGLFVFLFGETLRSIASTVEGVPGSCQLVLQSALLESQAVPKLLEFRDDDDDETGVSWDPLQLRFTLREQNGRILEVIDQIEWLPMQVNHFALTWLLACAPESPVFNAIGTLRAAKPADSNDWIAPLACREIGLDSLTLDPSHVIDSPDSIIAELSQLRRELRNSFLVAGLEIGVLQTFLDSWATQLMRARQEYVPDGSRSRELEALLGCDLVVSDGAERRLMLALHPIRLRWVCGYLKQTRRLAEAFLSGDAGFADGQGDFYLDWLEKLTPRESPPIAVGYNGQLLYSKAEISWCEDFSPLETDTGDIAFDTDAISSICQRMMSYLDTHPYKRDGISLLLILPTNDAMPAEILRQITVKTNRSIRVMLNVAVPKNRWESIARSVEQLSSERDTGSRTRLFPDWDLALLDYKAGDSVSELLGETQVDIAVVTHALQEQIISQQNTESPIPRPGEFDPLKHRPLKLETGGGSSISLVMLPKYPDPLLESWSTLVVRANRSRPVAPGQPENTDFVELRVNFQDSARLFKELHEHSHWVITLERHISRKQIESEEAGAPDVLSIEDGIGANRLNTLVVSSRSGRELIQSRLVRKLQRLVPPRVQESVDKELYSELAHGIYESTRRLSPKLALEALGVARVTEEIVGLTVARNIVERRFPASLASGVVAWISLDEHTDWFGGSSQVRADMCRLTLDRRADGAIDVDVLVLEGKLRQLFDDHGILQVKRTSEFFNAILGTPGASGISMVDADMWREQIAAALDQLSDEAVHVFSRDVADSGFESSSIKHGIISDFRTGNFHVRSAKGVYSACIWDSDDKDLKVTEQDGVAVIRSTRAHLIDLVRVSRSEDVKISTAQQRSSEVVDDVGLTLLPAESSEIGDPPDSIVHSPAEAFEAYSSAAIPDETDAIKPDQGVISSLPGGIRQKDNLIPMMRKGLPKEVLRRRYEDILGVFETHGISVSAAMPEDEPFVEGPASILFKVRPRSGVDPRKLVEKSAALKLSLGLEQDQNVSFNIDRGFVTIDVPKSADQRYFVDGAETWTRWSRPQGSLAVPIGEDRFGELVEFNFSSSNSPHLLVAGTTGSGKSEALNTILFGLTSHYHPSELRLMLIDPKGTELAQFEGSEYLEGTIGWDDADAVVLLTNAVAEMQRRYQLFKDSSKRSLAEFNTTAESKEQLPWWLIVLDEYADLTHDPQSKKDIEAELKRLAQKARAAGIHIIIATQKPSAEVISTNLRSNLPAQLALRVKNATESRVIIDESGAENLNGKGDGLLKADGKITRVQCSRIDPSVWSNALAGPNFRKSHR